MKSMGRIETSAPGKLVLFGEYAVLFGAPAVVAAVDRRAFVTLRAAEGERWEVAAPDLRPRSALFDLGPDGALRWCDEEQGRDAFGLVEKLLGGIAGSASVELEHLPPLAMTLDTRAFFESAVGGGTKLGLGSSAALTVALASAFESWVAGGRLSDSPEERLQSFVDLHREAQGGAGSGIDVAASLLGGVLRYQLADDGTVAEAAPMAMPEELQMIFVWTGRAASTGDFLGHLRARREDRPREVDPVLDTLRSVSAAGVTALTAGDTGAFLTAVEAFWPALDDLGEAIGMPVLAEEHCALRRLAIECGVRYKPSGAGGGDFGVGFTTDPAAAMELADRAASEGFRVPGLRIEGSGVECSS